MAWPPNDGYEKVAESNRFEWWIRMRGDGIKAALYKVTKKHGNQIGTPYVAQSRGSAIGIAERSAKAALEKGS